MINRKPSRFGTNIQLSPKNNNEVKTMKNGMTAFAGVILLIGLIFTGISLVLALTLSPWWFIAVAVCGAYSVVITTWLVVMRKIMNKVSTF
jgi:hypothetical protein